MAKTTVGRLAGDSVLSVAALKAEKKALLLAQRRAVSMEMNQAKLMVGLWVGRLAALSVVPLAGGKVVKMGNETALMWAE